MDGLRLTQVVLGVRHRRLFQIPALSGAIIDRIVNEEKSPFFRDSFNFTKPIIDSQGDLKGRILGSGDESGEGDSLAIDIDSVILTIKEDDIDKAVEKIKAKYLKYISKEIFEAFDIYDINREGLIFQFDLDLNSELASKILKKASNDIFTNPDSFELTFSEKKTDLLSYVLKEYFDYQNFIVSIRKEEERIELKFDYQIYFRPEIERISDLDVEAFINEAKNSVSTVFMGFLNIYEEKSTTESRG